MHNAHYDRVAEAYAELRQPDPRIAAAIQAALGDGQSVVNVGAGTGSYEPEAREVLAVDASMEMLRQRRPGAPAVQGRAERLPFADGAFDGALAVLTVHHWTDPWAGLAEMRRVARDRVAVLTWDPSHEGFWLTQDYFPEMLRIDREIFPSLERFAQALGPVNIVPVLVPADCTDGFLGAYWQRPSAYLDPRVRAAISTFDRIDQIGGLQRLQHDLSDGTWAARHQHLAGRSALDLGYRLVVSP